jgi:hypothetical protein
MAILSLDTLSGCNSIPGFISGDVDAGVTSRVIFHQTSAPTSWTKDTTHNNKALRVVNTASLTPGGTTEFTSVFTGSRAVQGTVVQAATGVTVQGAPSAVTITAAQSGLTVQGTTLTTAQLPAHTHTYNFFQSPVLRRFGPVAAADNITPSPSTNFNATGGGDSHTHGISEANHNHTINNPSHPHANNGAQHNHTFTGTAQNFAVNYVDVIIAFKN